ncbi:histone deacetylase 8 [Agrilus planipennis]|uniref:Histone deacetylase 8 n=1 Tax=Agrilus planipennis TaxID=224129 RepID=A0A1W4XKP9_AGRPL|nr:histone deacetylase 8 [Agrilus planipennis]XP_018333044.1 histone deacetylase 8 [Agrilus planipennis]
MKKVGYIFDEHLLLTCNRLPVIRERASVVQDLIDSYELLFCENITAYSSVKATEEELKEFHSSAYIEFLKNSNDKEDLELLEEEAGEFGLTYDCHLLEKNYEFVQVIAGGSLTAANLLIKECCDIAINWFGGWHHSQRDAAEGFCYVNDVVLAIQRLYKKYNRILYIDLDVHHGNGVQNAFEFSKKILTLSFHKWAPGFYPGSGNVEDSGSGRGKYYSVNVPICEGTNDVTYYRLFNEIFPRILQRFQPLAVVVQCGADVINGDPIGQCNLTPKGMERCIKDVLKCDLPTLFLGGGGYNFENTARYWCYLTSVIVNVPLENDIPSVSEYFTNYGPSYEIDISPGNRKDHNTEEHINNVLSIILENINAIDIE